MQGGDAVRGSGGSDAQLFCQSAHAQPSGFARSSASPGPGSGSARGRRPRPGLCLRAMPILASPIVTRLSSGSSGGRASSADMALLYRTPNDLARPTFDVFRLWTASEGSDGAFDACLPS